ncbi:MAG: ribbon-helix-helix protein, CopG family [Acidobacteria bacterium]|nr:ribbon-helix-helix protein, CopG family [Acidobacteriota bacterium]
MATATINISIPDSLKAEVEKVIESDGYGNTSEFFRDLAREYLKRRQEKKLEAMLLEAMEGDDFVALTRSDFDEIKKRGLKRGAERKKTSSK